MDGHDPARPLTRCRERREALAGPARRSAPQRLKATSADPLELAGTLGVALRTAERPQPERDEHDARHDQRPDVAESAR
ncbi:MAG: hypothetical protein WKF78_13220 [Candidatus Limnocylindrales bacterium]